MDGPDIHVDELEVNPFYKELQTTYCSVFDHAQAYCYMVCVPQSSALSGVQITSRFISKHILKPSPYFQGQYVSTAAENKGTIITLDGSYLLVTGPSKELRVKILTEEIGYNKDYKPYRILILESALDPHVKASEHIVHSNPNEVFAPKASYRECTEFLKSYAEYGPVMSLLAETLERFTRNYMILKDFLDDTAIKISDMCKQYSKKLLSISQVKLHSDMRFPDTINSAVEGYVLGHLHSKLLPVLHEKFTEDDRTMKTKYDQISVLTMSQLGVRSVFICPLPNAVAELSSLDELVTPYEKLLCVKSCIDSITQTIDSHVKRNKSQAVGIEDLPCLTSDDLIPLLVSVIVQAWCLHPLADVYYMENFTWTASGKDDISYSLVTFKAALEYMRHADFVNTQHVKPSIKQGKAIKDLLNSTQKLSIDSRLDSASQKTESQRSLDSSGAQERMQNVKQDGPLSRIDRQLARITRMLDTSDDPSSQRRSPRSIFEDECSSSSSVFHPRASERQQNTKPLGDFLASLKDDSFDNMYGKQS